MYIGLLDQDAVSKRGDQLGRLVEAICGTWGAPQICSEEVRRGVPKLRHQAGI